MLFLLNLLFLGVIFLCLFLHEMANKLIFLEVSVIRLEKCAIRK